MENKEVRAEQVMASLRLIQKLQEALDDTPWSVDNPTQLGWLVTELGRQCESLLFSLRGFSV